MTGSQSNAVPIVFENNTRETVWVQFLNGSFGAGQTGANGTVSLAGDTAYNLNDLASPLPGFPELGIIPNVSLSDFTNGRIYLNFGAQGLQGLGNGYQPAAQTSSDANYGTRYAYLEPNVFGNTSNNLDLTNIDFFSIALEASTWRGGQRVAAMILTNTDPGFIGGIVEKLGGISQQRSVVGRDYVRVIGPGLGSGYPDWSAYLAYLATQTMGTVTLAGNFAGSGDTALPPNTTAAQSYSLTASFDATARQVTLTGTTAVAGAASIVIDYADLNAPTGVYGANTAYSVNGGPKTAGTLNDVYGWIVGDLQAGMNIGFPGSATLYNGQALGSYPSSEWFSIAAQNPSFLYGGAQDNPLYYNQYAAQLANLTEDAYSFAYSDRIRQLLLFFPPAGQTGGVDYLKVTILPITYPA